MSDRDYVMPFGKHKGETLEEIFVEDPRYLEWCVENLDPCEALDAIEETLPEMQRVMRVY